MQTSDNMESDFVIRDATPQDLAVRAELVRCSITEYDLEAFFMLFFQEVCTYLSHSLRLRQVNLVLLFILQSAAYQASTWFNIFITKIFI